MKSPANVPPKKVYQAPKLQVYGDLAEMTKSGGPRNHLDGGSGANMRRTGH
jgi:hypothetical protein